jgi:SdpC family antimicrobial peptide
MRKLVGAGVVIGMLSGCGAPTEQQATQALEVNRAEQTLASGRDLFRGLFFGRGPVAKALPEIWGGRDAGGPAPETHLSSDDVAERIRKETERLASEGLSQEVTDRLFSIAEQIEKNPRSAREMNTAVATDLQNTVQHATDAQLAKLMDAIEAKSPGFFDQFQADIVSGDVWRVSKVIDQGTARILNAMGEAHAVVDAKNPGGGLVVDKGIRVWLFETVAVARDFAVAAHIVAVANSVVFWSHANFADHSDPLRHELYMKIITERMARL